MGKQRHQKNAMIMNNYDYFSNWCYRAHIGDQLYGLGYISLALNIHNENITQEDLNIYLNLIKKKTINGKTLNGLKGY